MSYRESINAILDKLISPEVSALYKSWSTFKIYGCMGLGLAILLEMGLTFYSDLSIWVIAGLILTAVLTFFLLTVVTKLLIGEERLVYYHHQIAVIVVSTILLWLLRQSILPYLDVLILGVGLFLACGRIGCFMVGCCHGRPYDWGVCYRAEHVEAGFTPYFANTRLFPIQIVESLWVFFIIIVGSILVVKGYPQGEALTWYMIAYGVGRFCFEFARGDPERPYFLGFSEAQWTSVLLMIFVIWAELSGILIFHFWHIGTIFCLVLTMGIITLRRHFYGTDKFLLFYPQYINEVAEAVHRLSEFVYRKAVTTGHNVLPTKIHIECISFGIQISANRIKSGKKCIYQYSISDKNEKMSERAAKSLSKLITRIKFPLDSNKLIEGKNGVFHLLIDETGEEIDLH